MIDSRIKQCFNFVEREDYKTAWPLIAEMLNDTPDQPQLLYLAGCVMRSQGHVGVALQLFRRALAFERKQPNVWMHFGSCLHDTHSYAEAREAFLHVHKALPKDTMPLANIAATYVQEGKAREAVEWAAKSLALDPDNHIARIARSFGNLALGRWADGWEDAGYLYGSKLRIRVYNPPEREEPMWDGSKGQTVVVQADQGLGDMIMFAQCLPEMIRDCKKVIVETNDRLAPMFRRMWPELDVYDTLDEQELEWPSKYEIDAHIHISHLGKFYRKTHDDFPRAAYLSPEPRALAAVQKAIAQFPRPWVGIAWRGGIPKTNWLSRSMRLEDLAPVIRQGGTFFNLCYQDVGLEVARWNIANRAHQIQCPNLENDGDYDKTIAMVAAMDHVVTVTTTVAHVCGALGKKAYVLVNSIPAWRYGYAPEDGGMIWYPENSVRLYRQVRGETTWDHAVARLARDYGAFVLPLAA